jgi:hypothetical protein
MTMVYIPWNSGGSLVDIAMKQIEPASALHFDPGDARLWVDGRESQLTPTQASMLRYFAFNSNRVISKQELLDMVWPDTHVTEALGCGGYWTTTPVNRDSSKQCVEWVIDSSAVSAFLVSTT